MTLAVDTIEDLSAAESIGTEYVIHGTAKSWLYYDQDSDTRNGDFNVSSVTDVSAGVFTQNLTNAMSDAGYAVSFIASTIDGEATTTQFAVGTRTAGGVSYDVETGGSSQSDPINADCILFGDLA